MQGLTLGKDNIAIHGYDTEKDEKKAVKDIHRVISIMAEMSFTELIKLFEPYRIKSAKAIDKEDEQANKKQAEG